jgi:hypothetical protein
MEDGQNMSDSIVVALVIGTVAGVVVAGLTFWALKERVRARERQRVIADEREQVRSDERERMRADEYFFENLAIERDPRYESRGVVFKDKWIVIRERLLYKGRIPLTQWVEREHIVEQTLDMETATKLLQSLSQLIPAIDSPFTIKTIDHHLPKSIR